MNAAERRDRIVEYLRIKPISHGQVYTFQIAVPKSEVVDIKDERREYLQRSLTDKGTNLIPLIVRRTEAHSEEEEYEVVYGADWYLVAKELDIEKLWVWVFDMTDEQAAAAQEEMHQLVAYSNLIPVAVQPTSEKTELIEPIVDPVENSSQELSTLNQKIERNTASTKDIEASESQPTATDDKLLQQITQSVKMIIEEVYQQLATLTKKIDEVTLAVKKLEASEIKQTANDDKLVQQVTQAVKEILNQQQSLTNQQTNIPPQTQSKQKDYNRMTLSELRVIASELNIKGRSNMKKSELVAAIKKAEFS